MFCPHVSLSSHGVTFSRLQGRAHGWQRRWLMVPLKIADWRLVPLRRSGSKEPWKGRIAKEISATKRRPFTEIKPWGSCVRSNYIVNKMYVNLSDECIGLPQPEIQCVVFFFFCSLSPGNLLRQNWSHTSLFREKKKNADAKSDWRLKQWLTAIARENTHKWGRTWKMTALSMSIMAVTVTQSTEDQVSQ